MAQSNSVAYRYLSLLGKDLDLISNESTLQIKYNRSKPIPIQKQIQSQFSIMADSNFTTNLASQPSGPQRRRRQVVSESITHSQHQRWKKWIQEERAGHERAMAREPLNPVLSTTGQPQHLYEEYQAAVSTKAFVEYLEDRKRDQPSKGVQAWWLIATKLRILKNRGLREWEWSCGEPEEEVSSEVEKRTEQEPILDQSVADSQKPIPYAERTKAFTYNGGDDPLWKGKVYFMKRRSDRYVYRREADFTHKMSDADKKYVPQPDDWMDRRDAMALRARRYKGLDISEQEEQTEINAGDYLFGGVSRTEEKKLEAESEAVKGPQFEVQLTEAAKNVPDSQSTPAETRGHRRTSAVSGCSAMSDFSSDEDD